jgi:riboflavin kinase/FMN adenylyltransferase
MDVWHGLDHVPYPEKQLVLALGNFDGLHRGHQDLLARMVRFSRQEGKTPGVFLFHPHPQHYLNPDNSPKMLLGIEKKLDLMAAQGVETVFVVAFDNSMASLDAESFVKTILLEKLGVAGVFAGFNYRFGKKAMGTPEMLKAYGGRYGFSVTVIPPVSVAGVLVSSTAIRDALESGDIETAGQMLGYWPIIAGVVAPGDRRGRRIGFPTANIDTDEELIIPGAGVYAGLARLAGGDHTAVVNVGSRPTFVTSSKLVIEAHLLQFTGSAYGEMIEIEIMKRLRGEQRFECAEALARQIERDIRAAVAIVDRKGVPGQYREAPEQCPVRSSRDLHNS